MTDYVILPPIHLGSGAQGLARKVALEQLATEAGCEWGDGPSIGRWVIKIADERISTMKKSAQEILNAIYENGRVNGGSSQEELENEFSFQAGEQGWTDEEIQEAVNSPWFPTATP